MNTAPTESKLENDLGYFRRVLVPLIHSAGTRVSWFPIAKNFKVQVIKRKESK